MFSLQWLAQPVGRLLTLTLLHFVWQGLAVSLVLIVLVEIGRVRRTTSRYACSLVALLAMAILPCATFTILAFSPARDEFRGSRLFEIAQVQPVAAGMPWTLWLETAQPYFLAVWFAGVALFGTRLLAGAVGVARLRRDRLPLPLELANLVEHLGRRLQMNALPLVFLSRHAAEAMAIGLVRPLVLIPAAWVAEMPLELLEAVIAHELAHLRRCDLWVNLLQRVIETLLFYHPAVWWVSRRLRIERELCADELAVAVTGKRLEYARALEQIAHERQAAIRPALAAFLRGETNMRLLQRVRNVLNQPKNERSRLWPAGILALALPLGLWAAAAFNGVAIADDDDDKPKKPTVKRERGEGGTERRITIRKDNNGVEDKIADKREEVDDRIIQFKTRKPEQPPRDEIVEERVIKRDGKTIYEVQLGKDYKSGDQGDRRIDELTALVKKLANQVERLQDEVKQLRGGKIGDKQSAERQEHSIKNKREAEERSGLDIRKRELQQAMEKIEAARQALTQKEEALKKEALGAARQLDGEAREQAQKQELEKALIEKKRAAEEKARTVREKFEGKREEYERSLKDRLLKEIERAKELKEEAARDKASAERKELEKNLKKLREGIEPTAQDEIDEVELQAELKKQLLLEKSLPR